MAGYGRKRQREEINHNHIPHDLTVDILAKLPVKSLLRFKCVSKHWHSLISNPNFINSHLANHQEEDPRVLIASACERTWTRISMDSIAIDEFKEARIKVATHDPSTMHNIPRDYFHMLHSCDGIVCFHGNLYIHVYNPSTREFRTLPQGSHPSPICFGYNDIDDDDDHYDIDDIDHDEYDYHNNNDDDDDDDYDDNHYDIDDIDHDEYDYHNYNDYDDGDYNYDDNHCYEYEQWHEQYQLVGFGRDQVTKEHKIIRMFEQLVEFNYLITMCEVFTLSPNPKASWRGIGAVPYQIVETQRPAYVNGALHWLTDKGYHLNPFEMAIVSFDLHTEKFQTIPLPNLSDSTNEHDPIELVTLRGCLCLAEQDSKSQLNIWIMKDDHSPLSTKKGVWEKMFAINLELMDGYSPDLCFFNVIIAEHKDGAISICQCGKKLYMYDPKIKSFSYVVREAEYQFMCSAYVESLVPVYGNH